MEQYPITDTMVFKIYHHPTKVTTLVVDDDDLTELYGLMKVYI
jgi:hypothetical protein